MAAYGWMSAMYVPAFITVVYSGAMKMCLSSSPAHTAAKNGDDQGSKDHAASLANAAKEAPGLVETFRYLMTNQAFLLLSFAYDYSNPIHSPMLLSKCSHSVTIERPVAHCLSSSYTLVNQNVLS